ncbi:tumor necrosis factor receptor superfamily member 5-like [Triplophysa dalaica]|uniref:tumor necrosis factor receptor superfamily member 5-like n=1 Tax=Triplophysa dalaica TaxID=1582913 RepID=UPI0024DFAB30|nr:tumor necrosis factor receptor superfamily member 5-like [Triplophysa dalaica]XP_056628356.1 tumor necrosis factor receptor superfamily member 5-like [Triplophysa dalaica]XP_056628357.1 tumor necrosis factor receptor superfamily member 5-like [Triplophysa dalaica]
MFLLEIVLLVAAIFALSFELCVCTCARAEYEIKGKCCPMCPSGNRVYRHCTKDSSTTCVPCLESTYTDHPNGLIQCLSCSVCDAGKGLRVMKSCTSTADVVCEPQEGFYCIDNNKYSCTLAVKHIECRPGQYIKQAGTAYTDTTCENCSDGFYSNGTLLACQPHSKCDVEGDIEIKAGTPSTDTECGKSSPVGVLLMAVFMVLLICSNGSPKNECVSYVAQPQNDLEPTSSEEEQMYSEEDHMYSEEEHTFSEEDHMYNEEEHTSGEEEHTFSEEDHMYNEEEHTSGEEDHTSREEEHMSREEEHMSREEEHTFSEEEHMSSEEEHTSSEEEDTFSEEEHTSSEEEHTSSEEEDTFSEEEHTSSEEEHTSSEEELQVQRGGATCPASTCSACPAKGSTCPVRRSNIAALTF